MTGDSTWLASMPEIYDRDLGPSLFAPYAADMAARVGKLRPDRVLELAAGTGILTRELVASLPSAAVVATDLNEAMVTWAAARAPRAAWRQADALALPFPDGSFDAVVCQFGVMFFPDKPAAFREADRVLASGGTLLFSVWDRVEDSTFPAALRRALAAVLPGGPPDFVERIPHGYADPDVIEADLRRAGLMSRQVELVRLEGSAPSARSVAEGFCLGTPLRFALQERGSLTELTEQVAQHMTAILGEGPIRGELAAVVVAAGPAS